MYDFILLVEPNSLDEMLQINSTPSIAAQVLERLDHDLQAMLFGCKQGGTTVKCAYACMHVCVYVYVYVCMPVCGSVCIVIVHHIHFHTAYLIIFANRSGWGPAVVALWRCKLMGATLQLRCTVMVDHDPIAELLNLTGPSLHLGSCTCVCILWL